MAIEDALRVVESEWDDIEPRLTVRELVAVAAEHRNDADIEPQRDENETLFGLLAPALDDDHAAWHALRQPRTRYAPSRPNPELVAAQIRRHAGAALVRPTVVQEAAADAIAEAARRAVLRYGYASTDEPVPGALRVTVNGRDAYPTFQFASDDVGDARGIVTFVNERLGSLDDPDGALSWWMSPNAWLGEALPAALVGTSREPDILYAAEQLDSDSW